MVEYLKVMREKANKVFWIPGNHDIIDFHLHEQSFDFDGVYCVQDWVLQIDTNLYIVGLGGSFPFTLYWTGGLKHDEHVKSSFPFSKISEY